MKVPELSEEENDLCVEGYLHALSNKMASRKDPAYLLGYRNGRNDRKGGGKHNFYDRVEFYSRLKDAQK